LQLVEIIVNKIKKSAGLPPPTLRAFACSVSAWLKRLRDIALKKEMKTREDGISTTPTLLGLATSLSSLCSGAEYLLQIVHGAIPQVYFESNSSLPAAYLAVHVLDHLYKKLDEVCLVRGGEEEDYQMLLYLFIGSILPYIEGLDSWLFEGTLDDPYEEMFLYVNKAISADETDFWEKSYLLRQVQYQMLDVATSASVTINKIEKSAGLPPPTWRAFACSVSAWLKRLRDIALKKEMKIREDGISTTPTLLGLATSLCSLRSGAEYLLQIVHGAIPQVYFESNSSLPAAYLAVHVLDHLYKKLDEVCLVRGGEEEDYQMLLYLFIGSILPYIEGLDSWLFEGTLDDPYEEMFLYVNKAISADETDFWEKSYLLRQVQYQMLDVATSASVTSFMKGKECGNKDLQSCPLFIKDIAKSIVSAGKLLQLIRHIPMTSSVVYRNGNDSEVDGSGSFNKGRDRATRAPSTKSEATTAEEPKETTPPVEAEIEKPAAPEAEASVSVEVETKEEVAEEPKAGEAAEVEEPTVETETTEAEEHLCTSDSDGHYQNHLQSLLRKHTKFDTDLHLFTQSLLRSQPPLLSHTTAKQKQNSADGVLLSFPDSLIVSLTKNHDLNGNEQPKMASLPSTPHKSRVQSFGMDGLDQLNFTYKVSWPLELIANAEAIKKYNQVMGFLLKVKRAKFVLDIARRWMWKGRGSAANNHKRHWLVEQKLLHFVDAFHQYVMDRVYHNAWREPCEGMAAARSLDEVIEVHELYLLTIQRQCFVVPDKLWALIASRINNILGLALDFYSIQLTLSGGTVSAIKAKCEMEVDRIEKQFDDCIAFLLRVLSFKLYVGHFPHLANLVTRINYNYFYMSDAGNLGTLPSSENVASRLGKAFLSRTE
ncbi:spindle pole body component 97-like, partial [Pyrus x bretschneideri]|uniref:spindle pole body component 97-like n=1 Tax=Pyrus x bretschneideri TaxID=225117 RepID=UPI002030A67E